jgi:peroxiredoxin
VVGVAPDGAAALAAFAERARIPFPLVADPGGELLARLGQVDRWWTLGRLPGLLAVDREGWVVYQSAGRRLWEWPRLKEALAALGELSRPSRPRCPPPAPNG